MMKNDDDSLLVRKAEDTLLLADKRGIPCFLGFLNEHQARLLYDCVKNRRISFFGGYDGALRVMMGADAENDDFPISMIRFDYRDEDSLTHRDFLGSLLGLGLEREVIGDILVFKGYAYVFVRSENAEFIASQANKIGRTKVKAVIASYDDFTYEQQFDFLTFTLASLRLDVFVSALCSLSRDKASKLIKSELVSVNHYMIANNSRILAPGDVITVRKYGKFVFEEDTGFSKKGKHRVLVKHYK